MVEKILIVDDDIQTLHLVGLMLEKQGYRILAANTGIQAITLAHSEHPDAIILDVMMPDYDGYEISRRLRKDSETLHIPILIFSARTQVEDKVMGYEAGADEYLTKPIHPSELTAHLRSLLSRNRTRSLAPNERGYMAGVVAAKGGLGVSTVALNLGLAFHQKTKASVIAAELRPGQGTWSIELATSAADGLRNLLLMRPADISSFAVEKELVRISYGIRLLLASPNVQDVSLMHATEQLRAVLAQLPLLAKLTMLDIGTPFSPTFPHIVDECDEMIVITEPSPVAVQRTRSLLDELSARGFGSQKPSQVVSIHRIRTDVQMSLLQMQEALGMPISRVIPPAPEMAYQAATRNVPFLQVQIEGAVSQQYYGFAEQLAERVIK